MVLRYGRCTYGLQSANDDVLDRIRQQGLDYMGVTLVVNHWTQEKALEDKYSADELAKATTYYMVLYKSVIIKHWSLLSLVPHL